jgi:hypothetical protein
MRKRKRPSVIRECAQVNSTHDLGTKKLTPKMVTLLNNIIMKKKGKKKNLYYNQDINRAEMRKGGRDGEIGRKGFRLVLSF